MKAMPHKKIANHMMRVKKHNEAASKHAEIARELLENLNEEKSEKKALKKRSKKK